MPQPDERQASIRERRVQYESDGIDVDDVAEDPTDQWLRWYDDAVDAAVVEPNAMTVASVDADGVPDTRIVLVRRADERGLVFFTGYDSVKSRHFDERPVAAATFAWLDLHRQVRVRGTVERTSDAESDDYFSSRPRESQIGAWASPQSEVIADREELERFVVEYTDRFVDDDQVPRPPNWGGWRVVPNEWEFWQGRPSRLHDRLRYQLVGGRWRIDRLAP